MHRIAFATVLLPFLIAAPSVSAMMPSHFNVELHEQKQAMTRLERARQSRMEARLREARVTTRQLSAPASRPSLRQIRLAAESHSSRAMRKSSSRSVASASVRSRPSSSASSSSSISSSSSHSSSSVRSVTPVQGTALQQDVLRLTNVERSAAGRSVFTLNASLNESAQAYARTMAMTGIFSHTDANGDSSLQRIQAAGYIDPPCDCDYAYYTGENLAMNIDSAVDVVEAWMKSPSHRENMLNTHFTEIGVGYFEGYWVMHFGHIDILE